MTVSDAAPDDNTHLKLLDENEQLRTALESALEENAEILEDRTRLIKRVAVLARQLEMVSERSEVAVTSQTTLQPRDAAGARRSETDEELRVAYEELQVLTEELEVANTSLQEANSDLESRVQERTRDIAETNAALGRSELRFRTLVEGMLQLVWRSADHGEWTWSSPQWSAYTGQTPEQSASLGWLEAIHPDDRDKVRLAWAAAHLAGVLEFEARIRNGETGRYRYFQTRAAPVRAPDGRILEWLGTSTDMDDLLRLQEQQSVLVGELQHRTRNLMAVVQAIMLRTIKTSDTLDDFRICIEERLGALARVQGLLSRRNPGNRVPFDVLLREELSAHVELDATGNGDQVTMQGPPGIPLRSSLIQTLALALHELATNAVKYGALAVPSGHLAVRWTVENDGDRDRLVVDWRETGVQHMPTADAPARGDGYGRELIEKALPYQLDARTAYTFTSDGVHCVIDVDIPLSDRLEVYNG